MKQRSLKLCPSDPDKRSDILPELDEIDLAEQPPVVQEDLGTGMCGWYRSAGLFGGAEPVLRVVDRVERVAPGWVHPMHGGSLRGETLPRYIAALRSQPFTFDGRLFGRQLPEWG